MLQVEFENPIIDQVLLKDSEYDINCPKCKKLVYSRRDTNPTSAPCFKCPNCDSDVSLVEVYFRVNDSFGIYSGKLDKSYLVCDNKCGWTADNGSDNKIKHEECGCEIGANFITSSSIEAYDIEANDPRNQSFLGKAFKSLFKK